MDGVEDAQKGLADQVSQQGSENRKGFDDLKALIMGSRASTARDGEAVPPAEPGALRRPEEIDEATGAPKELIRKMAAVRVSKAKSEKFLDLIGVRTASKSRYAFEGSLTADKWWAIVIEASTRSAVSWKTKVEQLGLCCEDLRPLTKWTIGLHVVQHLNEAWDGFAMD